MKFSNVCRSNHHDPRTANQEVRVKELPSDPMRVHARFVSAFCDDLWDMCMNGAEGTPRADAVYALDRQLREGDCAEAHRAWQGLGPGAAFASPPSVPLLSQGDAE
jgi:hypothetical protein